MNADFRLDLSFPDHPKTIALVDSCGEKGVRCLLRLWAWAAAARPSGDLSGLADRALWLTAGYPGNGRRFVEALLYVPPGRDAGFLEGELFARRLHGWDERQQYVVHSEWRTERARKGANAMWEQKRAREAAALSMLQADASSTRLKHDAPAPAPAPSLKQNEKQTTDMSSANGSRSTATVREIFDFWQWWTEKPHAKLTHDRRQKIQSRLTEGYSAQVIIRAILGCCTNPFNRGENDRSREYVDLTLICRNGSKLEGYADAFPENDVEREIARFRAERTQGADGRQLRQDGEA